MTDAKVWISASLLVGSICFLVIVGLRRAAFHIGLVDTPGGRKRHGEAVPLLGGIAVILAILAGMLVIEPSSWPPNFVRPFFSATALLGIAGVLDDFHEISPRIKLFFQAAAIAMLTSFAGTPIVSLGQLFGAGNVSLGHWAVPFTIVVGIGVMNAVNMIDGIDGLLGASALITIFSMAILTKGTAINPGLFYVLSFLSVALAVFLVFNFPYSWRVQRTFLGNTGSLFLGLVIFWFSVSLSQSKSSDIPPIVFVWLSGLFLLDFLCTFTHRLIRGRSLLASDRRHIHHLLVRSGFSAKQVCFVLVALHATLCASGITLWKLGVSESNMLLLAFTVLIFAISGVLRANKWVPRLAKRKRQRLQQAP
jgi:UDP-GlcNAc:undecaprenyl-phosphate/decaprenyl-phosphate GlcNAc-1-phosphate transferase